jgi:hypothetical protein
MNAPFNPPRRFPAAIFDGRITEPGLYLGVPDAVYHKDPCPEPSLSSHVGQIALKLSMMHAKAAHPRLAEVDLEADDDEDDDKPAPGKHLIIGAAAHSLMLQVGAPVVEVHVKNFKTKDAREFRKAILADGGLPLKTKDYRVAKRMAEIARPIFEAEFGGEFIAEAMLAWKENGLWRRGLVDGVSPDLMMAGDYKTCGRPCPPPAPRSSSTPTATLSKNGSTAAASTICTLKGSAGAGSSSCSRRSIRPTRAASSRPTKLTAPWPMRRSRPPAISGTAPCGPSGGPATRSPPTPRRRAPGTCPSGTSGRPPTKPSIRWRPA